MKVLSKLVIREVIPPMTIALAIFTYFVAPRVEYTKRGAQTLLVDDSVTMPIQVNGKRRAEINVPADISKEEVEKMALADQAVLRTLAGATPKKVIVVPGRIVGSSAGRRTDPSTDAPSPSDDRSKHAPRRPLPS